MFVNFQPDAVTEGMGKRPVKPLFAEYAARDFVRLAPLHTGKSAFFDEFVRLEHERIVLFERLVLAVVAEQEGTRTV